MTIFDVDWVYVAHGATEVIDGLGAISVVFDADYLAFSISHFRIPPIVPAGFQ